MGLVSPTGAADERKIVDEDDLIEVFAAAEKPAAEWRIGAEQEKFGLLEESLSPIAYDDARGISGVFAQLEQRFGWVPEAEVEAGPVIALRRGRASVTLEPGAQLELSGAPLPDVHAVRAELDAHLAELHAISENLGLLWLGIGFHPLARQADLPWVPKQRYAIMKEYLPKRGSGALDMMRRTATVQANLDFCSEEDALRKLEVSLRISPLLNAMLACSPFSEGSRADLLSVRGEVWLRMDPERSGLVPAVWRKPGGRRPTYRDYVQWALDAGMFLFKRGGRVFFNTGQSFRSFLRDGFRGERATLADWKLHLHTLFPEVRLKNTLELRACDSLPLDLVCALPALCAGLFYDPRAFDELEALFVEFDYELIQESRRQLVQRGLRARIGDRSARDLAERVVDLALGGLARRARHDDAGRDERVHLEPLVALVAEGRTPAEKLLQELPQDPRALAREVVQRTRV